jgi:uncharacterized protein (DUF2461 family)
MLSLLEDLEPTFGNARLFRPYRDVRFSKDKRPYKENIAASTDIALRSTQPATNSPPS